MTDQYRLQSSSYRCASLPRPERLNNTNPVVLSTDQTRPKSYSYCPPQSSVVPLMSKKIIPPTMSWNAIPQERESWIRSVAKTKINEGTEQKTQYLETMLRMQTWIRSVEKTKGNENAGQKTSQQENSSVTSSRFDRIRFADQQISTTMNTIENHLDDIDNHNAIRNLLCDKELSSHTKPCSSQITNDQPILVPDSDPARWSGFLIDNCEEEVPSPISPSLPPPPPIATIEERVMPVNELDTTAAQQKKKSRRQRQSRKRLQKKQQLLTNSPSLEQLLTNSDPISIVNQNNPQNLSSEWIVEYDTTDQLSQLTDMIEKRSKTMTDEQKIVNINIILDKIKTQQRELRKLRQHVMFMLHEESTSNLTNTKQKNSSADQDVLMKFVNQPTISGCWLCSGKTYTEVATQCDHIDQQ